MRLFIKLQLKILFLIFGMAYFASGGAKLHAIVVGYQPPLPRILVGYRTKQTFRPEFTVKMRPSVDGNDMAYISVKVKEAKEYMLSHYPNFHGSRWKPLTSSLLWRLPPQDVVTIYVIFKKKDLQTGQYVISPVIHYTFDKRDTSRLLERVAGGVIDWTRGALIAESEEELLLDYSQMSRTVEHIYLSKAQLRTQQNLYSIALDMLLDIRITPMLTLREDMMLRGENSPNVISTYANNVRLLETSMIKHKKTTPSNKNSTTLVKGNFNNNGNARSVTVKSSGFLPFIVDKAQEVQEFQRLNNFLPMSTPTKRNYKNSVFAINGTEDDYSPLTFYRYAKKELDVVKAVPYYEETFTTLVVDMRGYEYPVSLFPVLENEQGQEIMNAAMYTNNDVPFVRYVRNFDGIPLPDKTLFVKAYDVKSSNFHIVISERYWQLLVSHKETLQSISNGNFWILLD